MAAVRKYSQAGHRERAFTLIEILVAMTIFAVIALLSYRTLSSLFATRESLQQQSGRLRDVALLFARVESDFTGLLNRSTVGADGLTQDPIKLLPAVQDADEPALSFARVGFADSDGLTGPPQRAGYRLRGDKLEWLLYAGLDQAPRAVPAAYTALTGVRAAAWVAVDADGTQHASWPLPGAPANTPLAALQLTLTLDSGEQIRRLFALRHD